MKRFENQVAVITGAANGIGKACAVRFAEEGANIACLDMADELNESVATECRELGVEALALRCNVTDKDNIQAAVNSILEKWGRVDILVASAGIYTGSPLVDVSHGAMAARHRYQPDGCFPNQPGRRTAS